MLATVGAADEVKGRKEAKVWIPPEVYDELLALAGPKFVWERFPDQLRQRLKSSCRRSDRVNPKFSPDRLKWCLRPEASFFTLMTAHWMRK